jgi:outer membrane protein OmpA-like peptidoglycan-associated protein
MSARIVLVGIAIAGAARADPPSGYRCGTGKALAGKGCACPAGSVEKRDADNNATCAAAPGPTCSDAARRVVARATLKNRDAVAKIAALCASWSKDAVRCVAKKGDGSDCTSLDASQQDALDIAVLEADPSPPTAFATHHEIWFTPQVQFALDLPQLLYGGTRGLDAVRVVLETKPSLRKVEIQVHTDNSNTPEYNAMLSQRRAEAIRDYLVAKGIDSGRLVAKGYGQDKPLVPNINEANRARNRRAEFVILDRASEDQPPRARSPIAELAKRMVGTWSCKGSGDFTAAITVTLVDARLHQAAIGTRAGAKFRFESDITFDDRAGVLAYTMVWQDGTRTALTGKPGGDVVDYRGEGVSPHGERC